MASVFHADERGLVCAKEGSVHLYFSHVELAANAVGATDEFQSVGAFCS
jgi:hypothetical protein